MLIGVLVVSVLGFAEPAYAHFIVEDSNTGIGASYHVTPDHEPIAGKESVISYDFAKTGVEIKGYSFSLQVKSTKSEAVTVPLEIGGNVVMANYTFPTQGFYDVRLTVTNKKSGSISKLQYGQRVSRGVVAEKGMEFGLLEIGVTISAVSVAIGAIIFSLMSDNNKRKEKIK